jgi:hypothetical protein
MTDAELERIVEEKLVVPIPAPTTSGVHVVEGVTVTIGFGGNVVSRSDCAQCERQRRSDFAPSHGASPRCQSGGRPHCTCRACF